MTQIICREILCQMPFGFASREHRMSHGLTRPQRHPQAVISLSETFAESVEVIIDVPYSTPLVNSVFNPLRFYSNLHRTHQQFFKSFLPFTVNVRVPAFGCI